MLSVLFLYSWIGAAPRHGGGLDRRLGHHPLARLVPDHGRPRVGALGRGVLGMGVVDVQPGPVGEDDVGQPEVLVGELAGVGRLPGEVKAARVAERVLLLEVPPGPARPGRGRRLVGVHDLGRGDHGIGTRLAGHRDAVLGLGPHHPPHAHTESLAGLSSAPAMTAPLHRGAPGGRPPGLALRAAAKLRSGEQHEPPRSTTGTGPCWRPCRSSGPPRCPACRTPGS